MTTILGLEEVKKSYQGRTVLDIERLEVERGEILAVVGPSGAGKSTLLRLLNFLEYPDSGRLIYREQQVTRALPIELRRQVTTVFQHPALLQDSVEHNVRYGLRLRGRPDSQEEIKIALARMGLSELCRSQARTLSGGEAQRVALARAMILHPEVLLLDEPTANLDPYNIGLIEEVVREINQQRATTVVLVTHNIFQARRLAHRIGLMLAGRLIELVNTAQFFDHPGDPRTRAFVHGEMIY